MSNTKTNRVQSTEYRVQSTEYRVPLLCSCHNSRLLNLSIALCISIFTVLGLLACDTPGGDGPGNGGGNGNGTVNISLSIAEVPAQTVVEGARITLNASDSTITGAENPVYLWELVIPAEGVEGVRIVNPNAATTEVELPYLTTAEGTSINLGFRLTVTAGGQSANETVTLNLTNEAFSATVQISPVERARAGETITLSSAQSTIRGVPTAAYLWEIINPVQGLDIRIVDRNAANAQVTFPTLDAPIVDTTLVFRLTIASGVRSETAQTTVNFTSPADADGDGLIEIRNLTMLHNMRYSLNGSSYRTSATDGPSANSGITSGCPQTGCNGYELISDLDFDTNGDGTWTETSTNVYALDMDDSRDPYFVVSATNTGGWEPVGPDATPFTGIFDGNGYTIHNLAVHQSTTNFIGMFGRVNAGHIRNIHLVNVLANGERNVGAIAGQVNTILVSSSSNGRIVGVEQAGGASGVVNQIVASYSHARISSENATAGGLICIVRSQASANYATGTVNAATDAGGFLGGSPISSPELINANYSVGDVNAQLTTGSFFGSNLLADPITFRRSFGFAEITGTRRSNDGTALPTVSDGSGGTRPIIIAEFTLERANGANSSVWNSAADLSLNAWDFENRASGGGPSLRYADYDGPLVTAGDGSVTGNRFHCANDAANAPAGAILIARCGEHLPHQFTSE